MTLHPPDQRHGTFFSIIVYEQDNTHTIHKDKQSYPVRNHPCHGFPSIGARPNGEPGYEDKHDIHLFHVTFQKVHVASGKYLVVDVFVVWDQSIYVTGVVTIAAVATLAAPLFSPCNNIHDPFLKCYS